MNPLLIICYIINYKIQIFLARSKRCQVLEKLAEKLQIASFLAKELGKHRETISRIFKDLEKQGLAKCTNPEDPIFRYYEITEKGRKLI